MSLHNWRKHAIRRHERTTYQSIGAKLDMILHCYKDTNLYINCMYNLLRHDTNFYMYFENRKLYLLK